LDKIQTARAFLCGDLLTLYFLTVADIKRKDDKKMELTCPECHTELEHRNHHNVLQVYQCPACFWMKIYS
jgi:predicted RNA-binding Zn-ribbon protein involved in translation (DUF1610 family)